MKVEQLTVDNYDEYTSWWTDRGHYHPPAQIIPSDTYIVKDEEGVGMCAGSIYLASNAQMGWISFLVSNPSYDILKRRKAMKMLIESLTQLGLSKGCVQIIGTTENPALGRLFTKSNFKAGDEGIVQYFRSV